ncbi:hypothetical protein TRAVEDRAFT_22553 [Rhizophagus clarus]|uniref:Uncharacterized protein n=1 Tax=Rhizophagus clarus TaxID=94130 RepID=A0A8H3R575_9GLOM|nr:hypothetical protein TRAVEDRAFT_22553 [Rhizophagus clarus]
MVADALIATRINLNPRGAQPKMCDGWYIDGNREKHVQPMIFPSNHKLNGKPNSIKQILKERNIWPDNGIHLICEQYSGKHDDVDPERSDCCARQIMSLQPDFCEQKSILEEAIIEAKHIFERYLKFHCECNFIE